MPPKPLCIVGAGVSGLTLGRCLMQRGIPAIIFERTSSPAPYNYGITLHKSTYQPLLKILQIDESTFRERVAVDGPQGGHGAISLSNLSSTSLPEDLSFRCHRGRLEGLLREGQEIRWDHDLQSVDSSLHSHEPTAIFKNKDRIPSLLIVGCDGPHSAARQALASSLKLKVLPYVVFNGKRRLSPAEYQAILLPGMHDSVLMAVRHGDVRLEISISNHTVSGVDISYTYSRPAREGSDPLHKPDRGTGGARDIPVEFYEELESLKGLEQPFAKIFAADNVKRDRLLHWLMRSIVPEPVELDKLAGFGLVVVGDAAHAMPILGGEGANAAICDGIELAECITAEGVEGARNFVATRCEWWRNRVMDSERRLEEMHTAAKPNL